MTEDVPPRALVALFHCSFHPTKGNEIDWSLSLYPELSLEGIEFVTLPSGLHAIEEDVIYFSRQGHHGVCVFRKRETSDAGFRGARLGALGILLAKCASPMPWLYVKTLKNLADQIDVADNSTCPPALARFFETNKSEFPAILSPSTPILERLAMSRDPLHTLPKFFAIFGPSSLTTIRCILAAKRVMVHAHPSAESACLYAIAATEICAASVRGVSQPLGDYECIGMVGLFDIDALVQKSKQDAGWIACTTDRLFLEKPHLYDIIIDLTTSPSPPSRPTFFMSVPTNNSSQSAPTHRLEQVTFTLSELRVWSHIRATLLTLDTEHFGEVVGLLRDVPLDWFETTWMAFIKFWSMLGPSRGIRLTGSDDIGLETHNPRVVSERDGRSTEEEDTSSPHSPSSALLLLDRGVESEDPSPVPQVACGIVELIQHHIAFLDTRASYYSPLASDGGSERIELLPRDISSFDLNPFSIHDVEFCRALVVANLRRRGLLDDAGRATPSIDVQVRRPWRDMLAWLLGWS